MRKHFRPLLHIFSLLIVLTAVFVVGNQDSVACAEDRMYTFNMEFDGMQGSLILVESNGRWGLMDGGHRNADTIQDSNGRVISVPQSEQYSNQISMRNGKDVAQYMVNVLGVTHLDFIVGTHSHMDHIGGVPEIATTGFYDASGNYRYLVDSNTTYFYKEYQHIADFEDDLVRYSDISWHNQAYYYQATNTMQNMGANMVDVSKQQVIHGDPGNAYGDYVTFTMGNMTFRLYNVYEQTNTGNENVNSIVTVMTNGDYTVVNLSDINTNNAAIDNTSRAVGKDFGAVDVVVAGHHGYAGSNTKDMFDALQPHFVVVSNGSKHDSWFYTDCDLAAAIPYAQGLFGTSFFSTGLSPYAIVTDLSGNQVYVYNLEYNGALTDAFYKVIKGSNKTGWVSWMNTNGTLWSYLENGKPARNTWRKVDGDWYHFGRDGIMSTGWVDGRYYCNWDGSMAVGWKYLDNHWYYFSTEGSKIANDWSKIDNEWYHFNSDGIMETGWVFGRYYCNPDGTMATGWKYLDDKWYYFTKEGSKVANNWAEIKGDWYHFDPDGVMEIGWILNNQYYCDPVSGKMARECWKYLDNHWYYFIREGSRIANNWAEIKGDWYHFDAEGVMETGWILDHRYYCNVETGKMARDCWENFDGDWYYFSHEGAIVTDGWNEIKGDWYYLNEDGKMAVGWILDHQYYCDPVSGKMARDCWQNFDGKWYYFSHEGSIVTNGWNEIAGDWYYLGEDGVMLTGWILDNQYYCYDSGKMARDCWEFLDGNWYYFSHEGSKLTNGWNQIDGSWYFLNGDGTMAVGWLTVDGATYYLQGGGQMATGWQNIDGHDYYFDPSGIMARDTVVDGYYVGPDGAWVP